MIPSFHDFDRQRIPRLHGRMAAWLRCSDEGAERALVEAFYPFVVAHSLKLCGCPQTVLQHLAAASASKPPDRGHIASTILRVALPHQINVFARN